MKVFIDNFSNEANLLLKTLCTIDSTCEGIVFSDNFFLPKNTVSAKEYLCNYPKYSVHNLYYAFLDLPDFWQVRPESYLGAIYNYNTKLATIYFTDPVEKRIVERIEWISNKKKVYKIDYYNKYGYIQCREMRDAFSNIISKSYYTREGEEVLSYTPQNDTTLLFEKGGIKEIFTSSLDFEQYIYTKAINSGETIVFTTQRQLDVFTQMNNFQSANMHVIMYNLADIKKYLEQTIICSPLFVVNTTDTAFYFPSTNKEFFRFCHITNYVDTKKTNDALILTMSDQIEGIQELATNVPNITFHIAANTAVSDKLLSLQKNPNIKIYPQISQADLQVLLNQCTYYLDINYGHEIHSAIIQASMHNHLILGYKETLHNPDYLLHDCIFSCEEPEKLSIKLNELLNNHVLLQETLEKQQLTTIHTTDVLRTKLI